jgi:Monogalactosyldiacylglycerol (MGDG) synthase/Glycosyltransferase family 28 C-terminal domain
MKTVDLIYFNAGAGHRNTANALHQVISQQNSLNPRLVDIYETGLLKSMDVLFQQGINIYNSMLQNGTTFLDPLYLFLSKLSVRRNHLRGVRFLESYWRSCQPDLVVSTIPFLNRMLYESLQKTKPGTPFVTLITDFADCSPFYRYWIEPQEQFFLCPTERAVEQARSQGIPQERIFPISGVVINRRLYEPITINRQLERQRLGLNPDLPTGLVMFGGYGSKVMLEIAKCLERSPLKLQLIFICGRNEKLAFKLQTSQGRILRFVETFTSDISYYMHLSDFFIGKPGPGSISEALAMKLPVITECNASTLVQERYNAEWLVKNKVGIVLRNFRDIDKAVAELIQPQNLARYRKATTSINNKAVFEVNDILDSILERSQLTVQK